VLMSDIIVYDPQHIVLQNDLISHDVIFLSLDGYIVDRVLISYVYVVTVRKIIDIVGIYVGGHSLHLNCINVCA
jgi:hypothetical protein